MGVRVAKPQFDRQTEPRGFLVCRHTNNASLNCTVPNRGRANSGEFEALHKVETSALILVTDEELHSLAAELGRRVPKRRFLRS
jgi:hypothetical protein